MTKDTFENFSEDYKRLYQQKENKVAWRSAMSKKCGSVPLLKDFFDTLSNKYDYITYKHRIENNRDIYKIIIGFYRNQYNNDDEILCLWLHYVVESYVAFMVEYILYEELKEDNEVIVAQSRELDLVKKADLYCNGSYYQIKSKSFIYECESLVNIIDYYKAANNELFFIFYTIEEENVFICAINSQPYTHINEINGFSFTLPYDLITIKDLATNIKHKGKDK